jgi:hypothetical protein
MMVPVKPRFQAHLKYLLLKKIPLLDCRCKCLGGQQKLIQREYTADYAKKGAFPRTGIEPNKKEVKPK